MNEGTEEVEKGKALADKAGESSKTNNYQRTGSS